MTDRVDIGFDGSTGQPASGAEQAPQQTPQQAPQVPEQFRAADGSLDGEKLLQSYNQLLTLQRQQPPRQPVPGESPPSDSTPPPTPSPLSVEALGTFAEEFQRTGKLSAGSYKTLETQLGVPRELADNYIQGQIARVHQFAATVKASVGEDYDAMIEWASNALEPGEIAAFDRAVNSIDDVDGATAAVRGLHARFMDARRTGEITGRPGGQTHRAEPFPSLAEALNAMRDDKFRGTFPDPAYQEEVLRRLAASPDLPFDIRTAK